MKHPNHPDGHICMDCIRFPTCHHDGIAHANQEHCEWAPSRFSAEKPASAYDQMHPLQESRRHHGG